MITRSDRRWQTQDWKKCLADAFTDPADLLDHLELDPLLLPAARAAAARFALRVPLPYVELMRKGCADDPLLRQVLPLQDELIDSPGFTDDPVDDALARVTPGLLHKYHGRALAISTGACGIHCRYCFRRHYPYADEALTPGRWNDLVSYLSRDRSITEVILSGGDPLSLSDSRLLELIERLEAVDHVRRLRIHTRMPVVIPQRLTPELVSCLAGARLQSVVVIHSNHPREISGGLGDGLRSLREAGCTLLNQSVLLRGVNNSVETLAELGERLFSAGVLPYYLHLLDRVSGAAHFEVDDATACRIYGELRARLPGYLVPALVREQPNTAAKTLVV